MKGTCINAGDVSTFNFLGELPKPGRSYFLEDATSGTHAQNKAFHSLLKAWWEWMYKTGGLQFEYNGVIYNFETPDWLAFKDLWKYKYGAGFTHIQYVNDVYGMEKVKSLEEIPAYAMADFNSGNRGRVKGVLKSWADYTKPERTKAIQMIIDIIPMSGCDDKIVNKIIDGMEEMGFKKSIQ